MNDSAISKASALDLGAATPGKIAISIIGEMQSVLANRHGGALRERAMHDQPPHFSQR